MSINRCGLFLLFVGIAFFARPVFADNLLLNSGFEEGVTNWELSSSTATASAQTELKHGGDKALILTKLASTSWAYISQKVSIETGKYYALRGWGYINDDAITNIKLRFYWLNSQSQKISSTAIDAELKDKSNEFQSIETPVTLSPDDAQFADIQAYVYLNQAKPAKPAVFDDLVFDIYPTPTPTPGPINTPTPTPEPTPTPTRTPTPTPTPTKTPTSTPIPTLKPTSTLAPTASASSVLGITDNPATVGGQTDREATPSVKPLIISLLFVGIGCAILSLVFVWKKRNQK